MSELRLHLFVLLVDGMPEGSGDKFLFVANGDDEVEVGGDLPDCSEMHFAVIAGCLGRDQSDASDRVIAVWNTRYRIGIVDVKFLTDQKKVMTRRCRRMWNTLGVEDAVIWDRAIGYVKGNREGRKTSVGIARMAVIRRIWQFWR